jgi:hypothetical protein
VHQRDRQGKRDTVHDNTGTPDPNNTALRDLRELVDAGQWRRLPGPPDVLIFIHPYTDGSVDTLAVKDETDAVGERTDPEGAPVWHRKGGLSEIIGLIRALPHPLAPNAPHEVIGGGPASQSWGI